MPRKDHVEARVDGACKLCLEKGPVHLVLDVLVCDDAAACQRRGIERAKQVFALLASAEFSGSEAPL